MNSIGQYLLRNSQEIPDKVAFRYLTDGENVEEIVTYRELHEAACSVAYGLSVSYKAGTNVILMFNSGLDSLIALYGCWYAGLVVVPCAAPHPSRIKKQSDRFSSIFTDCLPKTVITTPELLTHKEVFVNMLPDVFNSDWHDVDSLIRNSGQAQDFQPVFPDTQKLALIQYTSGSTSLPKGVMLTHGNIIANQNALAQVCLGERYEPGTIYKCDSFGWVPFYHDMGMGFYLQTVFSGSTCTLMSPLQFIKRPFLWVQGMSKYKSDVTAIPNFALDQVVKSSNNKKIDQIDLTNLSTIVIGAEPVRAKSLNSFLNLFSDYGVSNSALKPCFGMAESTVIFTIGPQSKPLIRNFLNSTLTPGRSVKLATDLDKNITALVGNGPAAEGHDMVICNNGRICDEGIVGELWIRGPSVGTGYWGKEDTDGDAFYEAPNPANGFQYFKTGDMGFIHENELFICGRLKNMIIFRGRNIYSEDVAERVKLSNEHVGDSVAAFKNPDKDDGGIVVLFETRTRRVKNLDKVIHDVKSSLDLAMDVSVDEICAVIPLSLPKTTSGKVQIGLSETAFKEKKLRIVGALSEIISSKEGLTLHEDAETLTELQLTILKVIKPKVATDDIKLDDSLYNLGLDSVVMMQIFQDIESEFGVELNEQEIVENPTLRNLSASVQGELVKLVNSLTDEEVQAMLDAK